MKSRTKIVEKKLIRVEQTYSVCPVCLRQIPAERRFYGDKRILLWKECPEHGIHEDILWTGAIDVDAWRVDYDPVAFPQETEEEMPDCAHCAGLCESHRQDTCCTLLEVTDRCNMHCKICFADPRGTKDPSIETIKEQIRDLTIPGQTFLQLSGGEPTVRDDLPEIVAFAVEAGCKYIQLNSNGVRLANDPDYVKRLAEAGLSFVFLQFDGVTDDIYRKLRGIPMMKLKERAIENCGVNGIGVSLVPAVVKGVNDCQIGAILDYAVEHSPVVRGVHFQPASYFGRLLKIPEFEDRYTLDQLIRDVVNQSLGSIREEMILPSACDHPMCGFHGDFVVLPGGELYAISKRRPAGKTPAGKCCCEKGPEALVKEARANREFIGRRWKRTLSSNGENSGKNDEGTLDMSDMDTFLERVRSHGFTITAMAFQDAGNLDIERMRRCSLHVYRDGKKRPFCAAYLSPWELS